MHGQIQHRHVDAIEDMLLVALADGLQVVPNGAEDDVDVLC